MSKNKLISELAENLIRGTDEDILSFLKYRSKYYDDVSKYIINLLRNDWKAKEKESRENKKL
jgi:hypothetical protein